METKLEKSCKIQDFEKRIYKKWEKNKIFTLNNDNNKKETYTIIMPPPNITGKLHLGHALTYSIQDALIRFHRMKGYKTLLQPGLDHAGIAAQIAIQKEIKKKNNKTKINRHIFFKKALEWKEKYSKKIIEQQKILGISGDWERIKFTLDKKHSEVVIETFVKLFKEKLIYKGNRLVNWDPKVKTAISDLEVINKEEKGILYYIKYPIKKEKKIFLKVATTRPETLFGDVAIVVHPKDERYKKLREKKILVPITNKEIPIIYDEYSNPKKGSGAVKITPAHDFNDFEIGSKHNLKKINIFNKEGLLNNKVPKRYQKLTTQKARKKIIEELKQKNLLEKQENITHTIPRGERSGEKLEPMLTKQWFVNMKELAKKALETIKEKEIKFIPKNWEKNYSKWLKNIQPWCISRQILWGHRIPAWYGPEKKVFVEKCKKNAINKAETEYEKKK